MKKIVDYWMIHKERPLKYRRSYDLDNNPQNSISNVAASSTLIYDSLPTNGSITVPKMKSKIYSKINNTCKINQITNKIKFILFLAKNKLVLFVLLKINTCQIQLNTNIILSPVLYIF